MATLSSYQLNRLRSLNQGGMGGILADISKDLSAVTITTITTLWTPTAGKRVFLLGGSISVSAAVNVLFEDNAAGAGNFIYRTPKLLADTPYTFVINNGAGFQLTADDRVLKATASAAAAITGTLWGLEVN